MGFAFDGDADRFLAADNPGNTVDGDVIMSIIALAMKKKRHSKNDTPRCYGNEQSRRVYYGEEGRS